MSDVLNSEIQLRLEEAVICYQQAVSAGNKNYIEDCYHRVIKIYNPMDFCYNWYNQYKYLFDSLDDFTADYMRVFITVLMKWKPKGQRKKSRYGGSGEFKNYFIGSLNHNYINLVKSEQAAKRNLTKQCPICNDWVNPMSTHIITAHSDLMWVYLEEIGITVDTLSSCPMCTNFKISKSADKEKVTKLIKDHLMSKHSSLLFSKFNDLYPNVSTITPKVSSVHIEDSHDELDIYDVVEDDNNLINKLYLSNLSTVQKDIISQILNGESNMNLVYKPDKYKCTKDEWDKAIENLRETINIYGYE